MYILMMIEGLVLRSLYSPTRWYGEWYFYLRFPCYSENTTRVVFVVPLPVSLYVDHTVLDHNTNLVESY